MSKAWSLFSILVVFALLILLAPAAILLPGKNVVLGNPGENTTQEIDAGFNFTETDVDPWENFEAGKISIDEPYGLCLEQFTREHVIKHSSIPGCQYRNYTSANGTVYSGDLNGTLWMQWHTVLFNRTYNLTPKYNETLFTATKFGWMVGRGYFEDGDNSNNTFTFVFFVDFDSNDDMSTAAGKGFMVSASQTGRWANAAGEQDEDENMHRIIGDFDITKDGATYDGSFHLRDYPPEEVFDRGWTNVTGMVLQEDSDPIRLGLNLVSWLEDGPHPTPSNEAITTNWEEIEWGKDPIKIITDSTYMGTGGKMDISRNTILYLNQKLMESRVRIQGTAACNLLIDDTYAATGDDDTSHGKMYYLLPLYIPDQELPFNEFFSQSGYTFSPFGLLNPSTECYAGQEYFADALIEIEAVSGDADQNSWDKSYGLYPHPNLTSISPSSGYVGETLDVTISGKYLLRAEDYDTNTGSVGFGPNITVNSYWFKNSSPLDNEIIARITIDPGAGTVAEDVNVTSCFGYAGGQGAGPYWSDELADVFTVKALEGATIEGTVAFPSRVGSEVEPFTVKVFEEGNLDNELWNFTAITDQNGVYIISNLAMGTYDIGIKNCTCVSELNTSVTLNSTAVVDFGGVREGDIIESDKVDGFDVSALGMAYGAKPANVNWNPSADLNRSGKVDGFDVSMLGMNYGERGAAKGYF